MIRTLRKTSRDVSRGVNVPKVRVQGGLSLTPSQMLELSEQGIPISSHFDDSKFHDGDTKSLGTIDFINTRGIDIVDAWNFERDCRKRLLNSQKTDMQNYG